MRPCRSPICAAEIYRPPKRFKIPDESRAFGITCGATRQFHFHFDIPHLLLFDICLQVGLSRCPFCVLPH